MSIRTQVIAWLVLVAAAAGATWVVQGWRFSAKIATLQADHAKVLEAQAHAVVESVEAARSLEHRRTEIMENERDNAIKQADALADNMAGSAVAASRLRGELKKLRARYASLAAAPAIGGQSTPDTDPIGVLAVVLGELNDRAGHVGEYADRLKIAGISCERTYDAIREAK